MENNLLSEAPKAQNEVLKAEIVSIFGYDGLPKRYLVQSSYGWLNTDSWGPLNKAYIAPSRQSALRLLNKVFPEVRVNRVFVNSF